MSTHDTNGKPWAKLSEVKEGDTLIADDSFGCVTPGPHKVHNFGRLYIDCSEGRHFICGYTDDDEHLIGLYKAEESNAVG